MKWFAVGMVCTLVASAAAARMSESDVRQFEKGKTTYDQVVAKLGPPTKTENNDEGLRVIAYIDQGAQGGAASSGSIFAMFSGLFAPAQPGGAVSTRSMPIGASAGSVEGEGGTSAFAFDRGGLLLYYRATVASRTITSEDGAGPMPNVNIVLAGAIATPPMDGKPHLGVQLVPISTLDDKYRNDFAAAKFDGLVVGGVNEGSVAQQAGIRKNDYLYVLNGNLVTSLADAVKAMSTVRIGDTVKARAKRIDQDTSLSKEQIFTLRF